MLSIKTANDLPKATCALSSTYSYGNPPLFEQCSSTDLTTSGNIYLSVYVDQYCGGEHVPAQVAAGMPRSALPLCLHVRTELPTLLCHPAARHALPAAVQITPLKATSCAEPGQSYWSSIKLQGYYATPTKIAAVLNTATTNVTRCARHAAVQGASAATSHTAHSCQPV